MKTSLLLAYEIDRWCIVLLDDEKMDVREVPIEEEDALAVPAVKEALTEMGFAGGDVCLGLPSRMIFSAEVECGDLSRKQRRAAMLFRLEELLPMDVETLTADFLPSVGGRTLGAAVQTERVRRLLDGLADEGIEPTALCSTALLGLWELTHGEGTSDYCLLGLPSGVDVFRMQQGHPAAWYTVSGEPAELTRCLRAELLARPVEGEQQATARLVAEPGSISAAAANVPDVAIERQDDLSPLLLAARAARRLGSGEEAGWVNFLREGLESVSPWERLGRLVRSAIILGLAALVVFSAACYFRAQRYDTAAKDYFTEQEAIYKKLYPNTRVPATISSRLESEWRRIAGTSGALAEVPQRPEALDTLRSIIAGIPPTLRVRILDLRIFPRDIQLSGQTRSHGEAEFVSRSLEQAGFDVEPPRTEAAGEGVNFTLRAQTMEAALEGAR